MAAANFTALVHGTPVHAVEEGLSAADSIWQLRSGFLIMTMQSGFALLETGCVSGKNIVNIMIKNIVDVTFGALLYWSVGYGLSYGSPSNWFCGFGNFFLMDVNKHNMGTVYTDFFFQFTFASTATTIVSGAVAERIKLPAYIIFSFMNTLSYCIPAAWAWNSKGFLRKMGFYDFAGAMVVHGNGGASALVAAYMLGPRIGRYDKDSDKAQMSSPVTALTGTLILWWAWFGFNAGSTLGSVGETGELWKINALIVVNTLMGSVGGTLATVILSFFAFKGKILVEQVINGVLGGLVGVTACCSVITPLESLIIGATGALAASAVYPLMNLVKIDDPVGAVAVHFGSGVVATIAPALVAEDWLSTTALLDPRSKGLFHNGGWWFLGVQTLGIVAITAWSMSTTFVFLFIIKKTIGIRVTEENEELGADSTEHGVVRKKGSVAGIRGIARVEISQLDLNQGAEIGKIPSNQVFHRRPNSGKVLPDVIHE